MGKLISIARKACPCGWKMPKGIAVHGWMPSSIELFIAYECPQCGRGIRHEVAALPGQNGDDVS